MAPFIKRIFFADIFIFILEIYKWIITETYVKYLFNQISYTVFCLICKGIYTLQEFNSFMTEVYII